MVTVRDMDDLQSVFRMGVGSIVVSDGVVGNSLLMAGRIQNRAFPEVVLKRIVAFGEICKVSVGEGLVRCIKRWLKRRLAYCLTRKSRIWNLISRKEGEGRSICIMGTDI